MSNIHIPMLKALYKNVLLHSAVCARWSDGLISVYLLHPQLSTKCQRGYFRLHHSAVKNPTEAFERPFSCRVASHWLSELISPPEAFPVAHAAEC